MKKKFLCSTLAMAMTASMLFGCASESKTETTAAAGETTAAAAETTAEAAKAETNGEKLKVTLLVTGSFGDKAFNDSAQAGMEKLEAELGDKVEVNMVEMGSDKTKFEAQSLFPVFFDLFSSFHVRHPGAGRGSGGGYCPKDPAVPCSREQ